MRAAEIAVAIVFLALAALVLREATRLGYGWGLEGPQPGFFIFWLALILAGSAAFRAWQVLRDTGLKGQRLFDGEKLKRALQVFLPMLGAIALMEVIGFYLAAALYLGFFMRWYGRFSWALVVLVSALFLVGHYFVFEKWFLVPLPKGILEPYLGL